MPLRTSCREGTPSRVELWTADRVAAVSFYGRLFGWEFEDRPGGSVALGQDGVVAGITVAPDGASAWRTYLAVDDLDAAAARVGAAGGALLAPPPGAASTVTGADGAGRAALATDASGVTVGLWQAGPEAGATVVNEPGAYTWSELMTADRDAALRFYQDVFGLTTRTVDLAGTPFTGLVAGDDMIGGIIPPPREGVESRWIVYFAVTDVAAVTARAAELGATVVHGPVDTPVGPLAALRDPQGAAFSVWAVNGATG
ncbi:VOC family protein [Kitasatospora sp. NPDC097643]|uniref:VOC family protein n=1 Tax=Kitasatospora sp. NPDC097643 TaxID=3157230 RepID=UPI0033168554